MEDHQERRLRLRPPRRRLRPPRRRRRRLRPPRRRLHPRPRPLLLLSPTPPHPLAFASFRLLPTRFRRLLVMFFLLIFESQTSNERAFWLI